MNRAIEGRLEDLKKRFEDIENRIIERWWEPPSYVTDFKIWKQATQEIAKLSGEVLYEKPEEKHSISYIQNVKKQYTSYYNKEAIAKAYLPNNDITSEDPYIDCQCDLCQKANVTADQILNKLPSGIKLSRR